MQISVLGCGHLGRPLAKSLLALGHHVLGSTTQESKLLSLQADGVRAHILQAPNLPTPELLDCDVLVLNMPPWNGQWEWFQEWIWPKRPWTIFIGSIRPSSLLLQEEDWIQKNFKDWTILRAGGLVGLGRHPGKSLSGKTQLPGRLWPVNLVHVEDVIGMIIAVIGQRVLHESIDIVSDEHHTREEFYTEYALRMGLKAPLFETDDQSVKVAISNQRAKEIYEFKWPTMIGKSL